MDKANSLKQQYNTMLGRIKNGEVFLDNPDIPLPGREKQVLSFITLTRQAGAVLQELMQLGITYTKQEFEEGFYIDTG